MVKEELLIKLSLLEQQAEETRKQINEIEMQIMEMENLKLGLEKIEKNKEKEILAPLGRGIFVKAERKEEEVFANVGSRVLVRKTPKEAGEIIDRQIKELEKIRNELMRNIQEINMNLQSLVLEAQKAKD